MNKDEHESQSRRAVVGKRIAAVAILFFLFKGLIWIAAGLTLTLLAR